MVASHPLQWADLTEVVSASTASTPTSKSTPKSKHVAASPRKGSIRTPQSASAPVAAPVTPQAEAADTPDASTPDLLTMEDIASQPVVDSSSASVTANHLASSLHHPVTPTPTVSRRHLPLVTPRTTPSSTMASVAAEDKILSMERIIGYNNGPVVMIYDNAMVGRIALALIVYNIP